jgi:hypothetical protein
MGAKIVHIQPHVITLSRGELNKKGFPKKHTKK